MPLRISTKSWWYFGIFVGVSFLDARFSINEFSTRSMTTFKYYISAKFAIESVCFILSLIDVYTVSGYGRIFDTPCSLIINWLFRSGERTTFDGLPSFAQLPLLRRQTALGQLSCSTVTIFPAQFYAMSFLVRPKTFLCSKKAGNCRRRSWLHILHCHDTVVHPSSKFTHDDWILQRVTLWHSTVREDCQISIQSL